MIIYDCEIIKGISRNESDRLPDIEYCNGWRDFENIGISVIGAYDYREDRYRLFLKDNFSVFQELIDRTDVIIGFNNIAFDDPLCRANNILIPEEKSQDILVKIWESDGMSKQFQYPSHTGYGLDACCRSNFGSMKSGHGAAAPVQWQRGEHGSVIDYCLNDVRLTKQLLDLIITDGAINSPVNYGQKIHIDWPVIASRVTETAVEEVSE